MNLLQETTAKVKKLQGQFFLTVDKSVPRTTLARLEETVDTVIELVPVVEGGRTFSELRIKRTRGRKFDNRPVRFRVDSRKGIVFQCEEPYTQSPWWERRLFLSRRRDNVKSRARYR